MKSISKWMLGAAMLAGALSLGTAKANAAQFGIVVRTGPAYMPPCPGPGYQWVAGYYDGYGAWVPGYWSYVGYGYDAPVVAPGVYAGFGWHGDWDGDRHWDHERWEHARRWDGDGDRHWGGGDRHWEHDRGEHRGWGRR